MKKLQLIPGKDRGKPQEVAPQHTNDILRDVLAMLQEGLEGLQKVPEYTWKTECKMLQTHMGGHLEDRLQGLSEDGWEIFQVFWEGNAYRIVARKLKESSHG